MERFDKNGKKEKGRFPINLRQVWNSVSRDNITSDVLGSYSGMDADEEEPVQDADDL